MKKIALILALLMVFTMMGCDVSNNSSRRENICPLDTAEMR